MHDRMPGGETPREYPSEARYDRPEEKEEDRHLISRHAGDTSAVNDRSRHIVVLSVIAALRTP